ncbi:hypothetical protein CMI37_23415 [Candidatus Pacearchaeota archaeon]|nr:hypothetical protein [Candidatus Pacearchaeota archaeon]
MAGSESKVRVRLDTRQARGELRGFVREAGKTAGRVTGGIRSAVGRGMGVVGLGAGVGAGMQALKGATEAGVGDVMSEAFGPLGIAISKYFLNDLGEDARASRTARGVAQDAYLFNTAMTGAISPHAIALGAQAKAWYLAEEKAKTRFAMEPQFQGPSYDKVIKQLMSGVKQLLFDGMDYLYGRLTGTGGGTGK